MAIASINGQQISYWDCASDCIGLDLADPVADLIISDPVINQEAIVQFLAGLPA